MRHIVDEVVLDLAQLLLSENHIDDKNEEHQHHQGEHKRGNHEMQAVIHKQPMTSWEIHFHIADARRRFAIVLSHLRPWEQHLHITALLLCLFSFVAGRTISHRAIAFNDAELVIQIVSCRLHLFGQRASQLFQIKPLHDGLVVGLADNTEHHIVQ